MSFAHETKHGLMDCLNVGFNRMIQELKALKKQDVIDLSGSPAARSGPSKLKKPPPLAAKHENELKRFK